MSATPSPPRRRARFLPLKRTLRPKSGIAHPPFYDASQHGDREQDQEIEDDQQEQAFRCLIVESDQILGREHQVHQADRREDTCLLEQENHIGHEGRKADRECLREDDVAQDLYSAKPQAGSAFRLHPVHCLDPAAEGLCHVAAAKESQPGHSACIGICSYPDLGQTVIDKKELDEQGRIAADLDIDRDRLPNERHLKILDHRAYDPDRDGSQDSQHSDLQSQYCRLLI